MNWFHVRLTCSSRVFHREAQGGRHLVSSGESSEIHREQRQENSGKQNKHERLTETLPSSCVAPANTRVSSKAQELISGTSSSCRPSPQDQHGAQGKTHTASSPCVSLCIVLGFCSFFAATAAYVVRIKCLFIEVPHISLHPWI